MHPHLPPRSWRETFLNVAVIVVGFLLAFWLAALVLQR
jgi:hypothetical protein